MPLSLPAVVVTALAAALPLAACSTSQTLTIESVPPGAQITVDGKLRGPAPVKVTVLTDAIGTLDVPPVKVIASKPGYREKQAMLLSESSFLNKPHPYPDPLIITLEVDSASTKKEH